MPESNLPDREQRDIHPRAVVWSAIGLILTLITIFVAIRIFESVLARGHPDNNARSLSPRIEVPPPRLQTNPASDLAAMRAAEEEMLHRYAWVDRRVGLIRIPIERAIQLTVERGLPAREPVKGTAP